MVTLDVSVYLASVMSATPVLAPHFPWESTDWRSVDECIVLLDPLPRSRILFPLGGEFRNSSGGLPFCTGINLKDMEVCFSHFLGYRRPAVITNRDLTTPLVAKLANLSRDCRTFDEFVRCMKPNVYCITPPANISALREFFSLTVTMILDVLVQTYGKCKGITLAIADRRKFISCYRDWNENFVVTCGRAALHNETCHDLRNVQQCKDMAVRASCAMTAEANQLMCLLTSDMVSSKCDPQRMCDFSTQPQNEGHDILQIHPNEATKSASAPGNEIPAPALLTALMATVVLY
ncbi:hypothetical protein QR680_016984 [Steinernema hermaphroditum]|uniref:Uncharacterized protein n=1 Tax=Steinernema hermaphroditum TaxID=289476 RepID=A0AA39HCW6_9BILA|nr:hypothetical protein QR680_016984 [Steinernema hermaphroditum]